MKQILGLYCDGGLIGANPSGIGGTYAYCLVDEDGFVSGKGQVLTREKNSGPVTNNQTEMLALLSGLEELHCQWSGTIYSDSQVTLGRVFQSWKWTNIPFWMHRHYQSERARLVSWDKIKYVLLEGHPTKAELAAGTGKSGHPVSEYNVWCDQACTAAGIDYVNSISALDQVPMLHKVSA